MRRRDFISLVASAPIAWPLAAVAQQSGQMRRIGVLIASSENDAEAQRALRALFQGLQELGWKPGVNLQVDIRYGGGQRDHIVTAAKELVAARPDVLRSRLRPAPRPFSQRRIQFL